MHNAVDHGMVIGYFKLLEKSLLRVGGGEAANILNLKLWSDN